MKLFNPEMDSTVFKVRCIANKIWTQITPFFIGPAWLCVKVLEKIIARTPCFMHKGILSPYYIFNNDAYFFRFLRPLSFF